MFAGFGPRSRTVRVSVALTTPDDGVPWGFEHPSPRRQWPLSKVRRLSCRPLALGVICRTRTDLTGFTGPSLHHIDEDHHGASGRTRTYDRPGRNRSLCPLSYRRMKGWWLMRAGITDCPERLSICLTSRFAEPHEPPYPWHLRRDSNPRSWL